MIALMETVRLWVCVALRSCSGRRKEAGWRGGGEAGTRSDLARLEAVLRVLGADVCAGGCGSAWMCRAMEVGRRLHSHRPAALRVSPPRFVGDWFGRACLPLVCRCADCIRAPLHHFIKPIPAHGLSRGKERKQRRDRRSPHTRRAGNTAADSACCWRSGSTHHAHTSPHPTGLAPPDSQVRMRSQSLHGPASDARQTGAATTTGQLIQLSPFYFLACDADDRVRLRMISSGLILTA